LHIFVVEYLLREVMNVHFRVKSLEAHGYRKPLNVLLTCTCLKSCVFQSFNARYALREAVLHGLFQLLAMLNTE